MGFFSKLKNNFTGGWADVTVSVSNGKRGTSVPITVHVSVRSKAISVNRVYVKLNCEEIIEIPRYKALDRDASGDVDYIDVKSGGTLFEQELVIASTQDLQAEQSYTFEDEIDIPGKLPPTFNGRHAKVVWSIFAGLDMKGNDPDSGWIEIQIE